MCDFIEVKEYINPTDPCWITLIPRSIETYVWNPVSDSWQIIGSPPLSFVTSWNPTRIMNYHIRKKVSRFSNLTQGRSHGGICRGAKPPAGKKIIWILILHHGFCSKSKQFYFFSLKERSAIGWKERKTKFQIFPIFIFWVMVILTSFLWKNHPNFR